MYRKYSERKPVVEISIDNMYEISKYQYYVVQEVSGHLKDTHIILACDSLIKLKKAIKEYGWYMANIQTTSGCLSYGQRCVHLYPYCPKYGR